MNRECRAPSLWKTMTSEAPLGTPGPFEVRHEPSPPIPSQHLKISRLTSLDREIDRPRSCEEVPRRRYECQNYEVCLSLAASLNWESFTCRGAAAKRTRIYCGERVSPRARTQSRLNFCVLSPSRPSLLVALPTPKPQRLKRSSCNSQHLVLLRFLNHLASCRSSEPDP